MKLKKKTKAVLISCMMLPIVMTITFAALKIIGHIPWDWVWVLAPIWTAAVITVVMIGVLLLWAFVTFWMVISRGDTDL